MGVEGVGLHHLPQASLGRLARGGLAHGEAPAVPQQAAAAEARPASGQVAQEVQDRLAAFFDRQLRFRVHEATGRVMVQVIDRASGEVLDEIPPEQLLDLAAELARVAGLILDRKL